MNRTRTPAVLPVRSLLCTGGALLLGIVLGVFSKYLDHRQGSLPYLLALLDGKLDLHNFLSGFVPWILIAVCISIYSSTAAKAAVNVFLFFTGMVSGYYLYSAFAAGFFPRRYAMIWAGFALLAPALAAVCWHANKEGRAAVLLSAGILGVLFNLTFAYGLTYFDLRSTLNGAAFLVAVWILRRTGKENLVLLGLGLVIAAAMRFLLPFFL